MRFLHMADLHIGKSVNGMNLIEDQRYVLTQVLDLLKKEPVNGLLFQQIQYLRQYISLIFY